MHKNALEVFTFVSETVARIESQTGQTVQCDRLVGGGEYDTALFRDWFASSGAIWESTSTDSPQQDRPGERLNRTLWDRARPMMLACKLPAVPFLPLAVQYATHTRNLTSSTRSAVTPHFAMFGTNISADRVQVFRATVRVFVLPNMQA